MFDSILVPLDTSLLAECVLPHVVDFGRAFNAKISLLHILERKQSNVSPQLFDLLNWQISKAAARSYLDKISLRLQKSGLRSEALILEGFAAESVADFATNHSISLIILSSHGQSGLSKWAISSITQKILLRAGTSILLIRAHQPVADETMEQPYQRILVPLDGSRRAENVLPLLTAIARLRKVQIHLVHIVKGPEMARHMPPTQEDTELSNRIVVLNREEAARFLDELRLTFSREGIDLKTHVVTAGDVAAALHEFVEQEHIDLIALSAHGYSGNSQWPYGSIASNLILHGKVPLLIVQDLPSVAVPSEPEMITRQPLVG